MKMSLMFGHLVILLALTSCSGMLTHRDYLSAMEQDDSSFYHPSEDFPVVAGDTGRTFETESSRRSRTPASQRDLEGERSRNSLQKELKQLESKQSETSFAFYEKYQAKLGSTSEKIYFLQLPHYERKDYLISRGLIKDGPMAMNPAKQQYARRQSHVILGMSKDDVMGSLGSPERVEVAGNPNFENERWLYSQNGATKYIYFESGRVEGWE